jgi:hypothetical protein
LARLESCLRCGYDIRGRDADAHCPECGLPLRESFDAGRSELATNAATASVALLGSAALGAVAFVPFVRGAAIAWFTWSLTAPPCFEVAHVLSLAAVLWVASRPIDAVRSTMWSGAARLLALSTPAILLAVSAAILVQRLNSDTLTPRETARIAIASASVPFTRIVLMAALALSIRGRWAALGYVRRGWGLVAGAIVYVAGNVPLVLRPWLEPSPHWHSLSGDLESWAALGIHAGLAIVGVSCLWTLLSLRRRNAAATSSAVPAAPRSLLVAAGLQWLYVAIESSGSLFPANPLYTCLVFGVLAAAASALMGASWRLGVARPGRLAAIAAGSTLAPVGGFLVTMLLLTRHWDLEGMWARRSGWTDETGQPYWTLVAAVAFASRLASALLPLWCLLVARRLQAPLAYAVAAAALAIALVRLAILVATIGAFDLTYHVTFEGAREQLGGIEASFSLTAIACVLLYLRARRPAPRMPVEATATPPRAWEFLLGSAAILSIFLSRYLGAPTPDRGAFLSWQAVSLLVATAFVWASDAPPRSFEVRWTLRLLALVVAAAPVVAYLSLGGDLVFGSLAVPGTSGFALSFSFATPRFWATSRFVRESPATFFAVMSECSVVAGSFVALAPRWMRAPPWIIGAFATLLALALGTVLSPPALGWRAVPWSTRFNRTGSDPMTMVPFGILRPISFDGLLFVVWALAEAPRVAARWRRRDRGSH